MNIRPTRLFRNFVCFIVTSFLLNISCSKDTDTLLDAVLNDDEVSIIEENDGSEDQIENQNEDEDIVKTDEDLESRTTVFPVINDAYIQNGTGYDQELVRLQENFRSSYLMFDISEIDSIGGFITSARLEFIIATDDGDGIIKIFKGTSNNWTENSLSDDSAPETGILVGELEQTYSVGSTVTVDLDISQFFSESSTLILEHQDGDDLAFASKENKTALGPRLVVTYDSPISAKNIVVEDEQVLDNEDDSQEEDTTEEDTTEEDNTEEENTTQEDNTEDDTTEEDTTEEDNTEDDATEEDTTEDDSTEEDTSEEDTTEEETNSRPQAIAEASILSGVVPLEVSFTGNKSTDDKGITGYEWNFSDGSTASSTNVAHTFTEAGTYEVILKVIDEEGLDSTDAITITVSEKENEAPVAKAGANIFTGSVPLEVRFVGSNSTDDTKVVNYTWNFKDGTSSNEANPSHTFTAPGTYVVELTVQDEDSLIDKDTLTIQVDEAPNEAPIAVAVASALSGEAPLVIDFTGNNSSDDQEIVSYTWDFPESSSANSNTSYTFESAGVYNVTLTVTDRKGLQDSETLSINVTEKINNDICTTSGGFAGDEGPKTWCWTGDLADDVNGAGGLDSFSNSQLAKSTNYDGGSVFAQNGRLNFSLNPTNPSPPSGSKHNYNYRSEIRDSPSNVDHPLGTEQWWGFDYRFGEDYISDNMPWVLWQTHGSFQNPSNPMTSLQIGPAKYAGTSSVQGELFIANSAISTGSTKVIPTGIVPSAGQTLKVVIHLIWGDNNTGLYQVWVDGVQVYNEQERTVYVEQPEGGYWKIGIYKWRWQQQSNVSASAAHGIHELNSSIGALRVIKKSPNNSTYRSDDFNRVNPN